MSARTLRALWRNRHRVDAAFRRDPANRAKFIQVFREPRGLTHELRRMNLYGILGRYLPAFGRIVGQMQHDLFHVYTVDEHILMVIRNLRRFTEPQHAHEYPLCSRLIADFERKEVLYLAGLFHDIAKGRGGDHSALGERDARRFCRAHGLPPEDTELVAWLVGAAPVDVGDGAEAGRHRSRRRRRLRRAGRHRAPPVRALPADGRRHPRHQPEGVERVEGEAARGPVPRDAGAADRRAARHHAGRQPAGAADRGAPAAAAVRGARRRRARPVGAARQRLLPAPDRRRDRLARAAPVLPHRRREARRQGAPRARRRRAAGVRLPARPEGPVRAHLRLLRPLGPVDPRRQDPHDAPRLRARHLRRARSRPTPTPAYRETIQFVEFELARAARAASAAGGCRPRAASRGT